MAAGKGKASKTAVWVIIALLIIGLAGFGTTNFGGSAQRVAAVGEREITVQDYADGLQQELRALSAQTGTPITLSQSLQFGLDQGVLRRLLATAALENETMGFGLSVGDAAVREQILQVPAFQGLDGNFDRDAYREVLRRSNLSEGEFEEDIRLEAARSLVQAGVISGIAVPETFSTALLTYVAETRDITWARMGPDDLVTGLPVATEADLAAFHQENAADYTLPETRKITYAWLTPDMIVDTIDVDEAALQQAYEDRSDEFNQPERRLVERLVFPDTAAAQSAIDRVEAGETTFEALVEERGLTLQDADMGDVTQGDLGAAGDAVFALAEPGVVGPVDTALGAALFRMNAILPASTVSFEQARPDLLAEFAADAARRAIADEINPIDDLLAGGATLEEVADETPLELGQIDWTPESGEDIAAYQAFRDRAADVTADDFPEIVELDDGGIFAMRLDDVVAPQLQDLADVRDQVEADWNRAQETKALVALAEGLVPQIAEGVAFSSLGLSANQETAVGRTTFIQETPIELLLAAFDMAPGEARALPGDGAAFVLRLDSVNAPDLQDEDTARTAVALAAQTRQSMAQDVFEAFTSAVQAEAGISVNQAMINAVHAQFP